MESDADATALAAFIEGVGQAQALDRKSVRNDAAMRFETERISTTQHTCVTG